MSISCDFTNPRADRTRARGPPTHTTGWSLPWTTADKTKRKHASRLPFIETCMGLTRAAWPQSPLIAPIRCLDELRLIQCKYRLFLHSQLSRNHGVLILLVPRSKILILILLTVSYKRTFYGRLLASQFRLSSVCRL